MRLTAGTRVGPYEIRELLGAGGMGEVYRARDARLGRDVALKTLPALWLADPERRDRFDREARVLAALNHPNIGAIYGVEEHDGTLALVLELVQGPTLADLIAHGTRDLGLGIRGSGPDESRTTKPESRRGLPVAEALGIARQLAEALEAAHERGIVHRDLKPANIILQGAASSVDSPPRMSGDINVKAIDFGLGKAFATEGGKPSGAGAEHDPPVTALTIGTTHPGVVLGTPAYMSPEQARGKPVDKRSDIWSYGCVLYEMLTGRPPFQGESIADALVAVLEREPDWRELPAATPASLDRLLRRCLEKDQTDPEAYDLYLRGLYHTNHFAHGKAIECFQAAVEKDPSYGLAYAELALNFALIPIMADVASLEYLEKSRRAAEKALTLNPLSAEAHSAAGWGDFFLGWDWLKAERALRRAIELNPNYALGQFYCAHLLSNSFRHDEAIAMIRKARDLDPLSPAMHSFHGQFLFDARRYDEALEPIQRAIAIDPGFFHGHEILSRWHLQRGDLKNALEACEMSYQLSGGMLFALARKGYALAKTGARAEADGVMASLRATSRERFVAPFHFALVHAGLGNRGEALDCLEQAVDVRAVHLVLLPTDPLWDEYRDEPRFRAALEKCGFPERPEARGP